MAAREAAGGTTSAAGEGSDASAHFCVTSGWRPRLAEALHWCVVGASGGEALRGQEQLPPGEAAAAGGSHGRSRGCRGAPPHSSRLGAGRGP